MIPLMVRLARITQHQAHGTSLVALVFTGAAGAATYALHGAVDVTAAVLLSLPAVFTARMGARYAQLLPEWKLKRGFGIFVLVAALLLVAKSFLPAAGPGTDAASLGLGSAAVLLVGGVFSGFLSGLMGVGGGIVMIPVMVLGAGFGQHLAQGTSLLSMVPSGAAGAHKHLSLGNVVKRLLPGLVPGILAGSYLGARVAHLLPGAALRLVFAAFLLFTASRYLRARPPPAAAR